VREDNASTKRRSTPHIDPVFSYRVGKRGVVYAYVFLSLPTRFLIITFHDGNHEEAYGVQTMRNLRFDVKKLLEEAGASFKSARSPGNKWNPFYQLLRNTEEIKKLEEALKIDTLGVLRNSDLQLFSKVEEKLESIHGWMR